MTVMMPREKWTEERLDDLNKKVDDGFTRVEKKIDDGLRELRGEFKALNRNLLMAAVAIVVALIGTIGTLSGIAFL